MNLAGRGHGIETTSDYRLSSFYCPLVLKSDNLTQDELIRLTCALGEIGGTEAQALLEQMRAAYPSEMTNLQNEIDVAQERSHYLLSKQENAIAFILNLQLIHLVRPLLWL